MMEIYPTEAKDSTIWQPRPADPELEAEMLRRLMVRLGAEEARAEAAIATPQQASERARIASAADGQVMLVMDEAFDRAWRRVGLALDRIGFTVEDRDRAQGLYFVRYVDPDADNRSPQKGFLSAWPSGAATTSRPPAAANIACACRARAMPRASACSPARAGSTTPRPRAACSACCRSNCAELCRGRGLDEAASPGCGGSLARGSDSMKKAGLKPASFMSGRGASLLLRSRFLGSAHRSFGGSLGLGGGIDRVGLGFGGSVLDRLDGGSGLLGRRVGDGVGLLRGCISAAAALSAAVAAASLVASTATAASCLTACAPAAAASPAAFALSLAASTACAADSFICSWAGGPAWTATGSSSLAAGGHGEGDEGDGEDGMLHGLSSLFWGWGRMRPVPGRSLGASGDPLRLPQCTKDVLACGFMSSGCGGGAQARLKGKGDFAGADIHAGVGAVESRAPGTSSMTMPIAKIDSLDHEGRGVTRVEGKAVFVEGALPGERVEYVVGGPTRAMSRREQCACLRPSAQRVAPRCPHYGVCGGCSMQHLDADAQAAAKQRILEDALWHIGKLRPGIGSCRRSTAPRGATAIARLGRAHGAEQGRAARGIP